MTLRQLLALLAVIGTCGLLVFCECREYRAEAHRLRRELEELAVPEIAGDNENQRWAASMLAARARVAIRALKRQVEDRGPAAEHCSALLARIVEEMNR